MSVSVFVRMPFTHVMAIAFKYNHNSTERNIPFKVEDVWSLSKKDRWRLYRRWMVTKSDSYKRTITQYRQQFEENARKLKEIQAMEDMIVLKKADVIGMTTTGYATLPALTSCNVRNPLVCNTVEICV